jgi:SAM-dependent methyltransferase
MIDIDILGHSVTSDCKQIEYNPHVYICKNCKLVQKGIDDDYLLLIKKIYESYEIYSQAGGTEQAVFTLEGDAQPRSTVLLNWINTNTPLNDQGDLLEIGCGNGAFLKTFSKFKAWNLIGTEFDDRNKATIEKIDHTTFYSGNLVLLNKKFDLLVMIHVLEHILNPQEFLISCAQKLRDRGRIFIQVPDIENSPFDVHIADHCSHFSMQSLINLAINCNYKIVAVSNRVIAKEVSIILEKNYDSYFPKLLTDYQDNNKVLVQKINLLEPEIAIGIFGSSIAATIIASQIKNKMVFFVDEDINKIGNYHLSLPILSIDKVPHGAVVILPFKKIIAEKIVYRLRDKNIKFIY